MLASLQSSLKAVRARAESAFTLCAANSTLRAELEVLQGLISQAQFQADSLRPTGSTENGCSNGSSSSKYLIVPNLARGNGDDLTQHLLEAGTGSTQELQLSPVTEARLAPLTACLAAPEAATLLRHSGTMCFDAVAFGALPSTAGMPLQVLNAHLATQHGFFELLEEHRIISQASEFRRRFFHFMGAVESSYRSDVPYHNALHAADVLMTCEWLLRSPSVQQRLGNLEQLLLLIAASIHDIGHPGRNNLFQIKTLSPVAVTYNDKSVLENFSISLTFKILLQDARYNWFELLPRRSQPSVAGYATNLQDHVRRCFIQSVLGTDMAFHAEHVGKLKSIGEDRGPALTTPEEVTNYHLFLMESILHGSDISNPCKPKHIMLEWTQRVLEEFWTQGDEEIRLGLDVSPLCDRESGSKNVPKGQIGFITFVVEPYFNALQRIIPEAQEAVDTLAQNKLFWQEVDREGSSSPVFGRALASGTHR